MITPNLLTSTSIDTLPAFHICPTCGASALTGKSARFATAWELVHGRNYPNRDYSIPCPRHEGV